MEREVPLTKEDIIEIGKSAGQYRNLALFFLLPFLFGLVGYFLNIGSTFFLVISIIGFILSGICIFVAVKIQKDLKLGVKFVIEGVLEFKRIHRSGSSISFEVLDDGMVKINEETPSGSVNSVEPIILPAGKKDIRFFLLQVGGVEYKVSRAEFFKYEEGVNLCIERISSGKVILVREL
jgi:hypothetical protein